MEGKEKTEHTKEHKGERAHGLRLGSAQIMTLLVVGLVALFLIIGMLSFVRIYQGSMEEHVRTSSDQAAVQTLNSVNTYLKGIEDSMDMIREVFAFARTERDRRLNSMVDVRGDIAAITSYNPDTREMQGAWSGHQTFKWNALANLSFNEAMIPQGTEMVISKPHVESLLVNSYPWVVSVSERLRTQDGVERVIVLDANFSQLAGYIDNVGVGSHGYCFIMDTDGSIIYHPQQELIFAGIKTEETAEMAKKADGSYKEGGMIYTVRTREGSGWRVVAVSFLDEMIAARLKNCVGMLLALLAAVLFATVVSSAVLARYLSRPIARLNLAMGAFEQDAEGFVYQEPAKRELGSREVQALSASFAHMVVRIQELMSRVRREEIVLRKTELRALQAQINPHFLYNTLDSIAWMCEDGRNREAVKMVSALARLFRISISKGHELIPIEKEVEHARSYLEIQQFRYKNQFACRFEVEESCLGYYCNKITLQPIIENAIYHGLNRMIDEGLIVVCIWEEGDDVMFSVSDNGVGMTQEQCAQVLCKEKSGKDGIGGIGIKNVNDRAKIYFGEQYGLHIESELDEGTTVYVRIPKLLEEPRSDKQMDEA